nr:alpha-tocopherol transfer protein-like [Danaus plexippus plexippus]
MDSLTVSPILQHNADALQYIRRQYNLDLPERIQESVNILSDWINKQDHLVKKNYGSDYLERILINCKGSVEKAKMKLDKLCSLRTALPIYFEPFDRKHPAVNKIVDGFLPKMTPDHCRVFLLRNNIQKFDFVLLDFYRALIAKVEYLQTHDYNNGIIVIFDYRGLNILDFMKIFNITEIEDNTNIITEGYGMRIKSIHIITSSNLIDMVVSIIKQGMSEKLGKRINVHKSLDSIYNFVPKDIMPEDYGGSEKTLQQLHENLLNELTSYKFKNHLTDMRNACTNEIDDAFSPDLPSTRVFSYVDYTLVIVRSKNLAEVRQLTAAAATATTAVANHKGDSWLQVSVTKKEALPFYESRGGVFLIERTSPFSVLSWSFAGYFSLLAPNLKTGSTSLGKILPNMGGPRAPYRRLYAGIVMSMALYGAPILSEALTASSKALLHRAQRTIAERGIGGYRTVSFTTATLLAGYRYSRKYLLLHTGTERKPQPARMRALSH